MIFVDSGAWYASLIPTDPDHAAAQAWLRQNNEPLLTTDFIMDETLTLLRARGQNQRASKLGSAFLDGSAATFYRITLDELYDALEVFQRFADKEWSFTDCTSKVVMEKLGMTTAFSFDHHFRQFGTVRVSEQCESCPNAINNCLIELDVGRSPVDPGVASGA